MIVVTGGNGFVGSHLCRELADRGEHVRAVVRRPGTAPDLDGVEELVGSFDDPEVAEAAVADADALVTTAAPMGADRETQRRVTVDGTVAIATAARDAGVRRLVHLSTCSVYDRSPDRGDVDEDAALVDDDAGAYDVTKRDADLALAELDGITRVLVRPPSILGPGQRSMWNTQFPTWLAQDPSGQNPNPDKTFAWVHVADLVGLIAAVAAPPVGDAPARSSTTGPVEGDVNVVNVAAPGVTWRDYLGGVAAAIGVTPHWSDEPAWTGDIVAARARSWGWEPTVTFDQAMRELTAGLDDLDLGRSRS